MTVEKNMGPRRKELNDRTSVDQNESVGLCVHARSGAVRRKRMQLTKPDG